MKFIVNETEINCIGTDTILELKKEVIKVLGLECPYIDISYEINKPMRVLGKFNVEPGLLPRTFDNYALERFAFKEDVDVNISLTEVSDYEPRKRTPFISGGRGRGRCAGTSKAEGRGTSKAEGRGKATPQPYRLSTFDHTQNQVDMTIKEPTFSLDSQEDFPPLS